LLSVLAKFFGRFLPLQNVVPFVPLTEVELAAVAALEIAKLARRLEARPPGRARRSRRAPHLRWCSGSAHGAG